MTYSDSGKRETLYYRLLSQTSEAPGTWGHEYVRHLAAELGEEYGSYYTSLLENEGKEDGAEGQRYTNAQLRELALQLVDFFLQHNAEADAVDLLLELECIGEIVDKVDAKTFERTCRYMEQ
jgi:26S proteasome regulatory subunit N1